MAKKPVSFIATKYKDKPVRVSFYTKKGERVSFAAEKKVPVKVQVRFKARKK